MFFDSLRASRTLRLTAAFSIAAAALHPMETPQAAEKRAEMAELKLLAAEIRNKGPLAHTKSFARFSELMKKTEGAEAQNFLVAAGFCAHGSGSSPSGNASSSVSINATACRRRRGEGDLSHLLSIDYPF